MCYFLCLICSFPGSWCGFICHVPGFCSIQTFSLIIIYYRNPYLKLHYYSFILFFCSGVLADVEQLVLWGYKKALICSVGQCSWCKYSHWDWFQATNMISLNKELGRDKHKWLFKNLKYIWQTMLCKFYMYMLISYMYI